MSLPRNLQAINVISNAVSCQKLIITWPSSVHANWMKYLSYKQNPLISRD